MPAQNIFASAWGATDVIDLISENALLRTLGPTAAALISAGRRVSFTAGSSVWTAGGTPRQVLFVERGLVSLQWSDAEGAAAEVAAIGSEGAVGLVEALAHGPMTFEARAELATIGLLVPAEPLRRLVESDPAAAALCWAYALERLVQTRRGVGCAVRHGSQARLADYLLARTTASNDPWLALTQEALAAALGLYRTTVTALLAQFVDDGLVTTGRGRLRVLDAGRLAQAACGCRGGLKLDKRQTAQPG